MNIQIKSKNIGSKHIQKKNLDDNLIAEIIEKVETSYKKDLIYKYISDVSENCAKLCAMGENLRVLNAVKLMMDNLINELDL